MVDILQSAWVASGHIHQKRAQRYLSDRDRQVCMHRAGEWVSTGQYRWGGHLPAPVGQDDGGPDFLGCPATALIMGDQPAQHSLNGSLQHFPVRQSTGYSRIEPAGLASACYDPQRFSNCIWRFERFDIRVRDVRSDPSAFTCKQPANEHFS